MKDEKRIALASFPRSGNTWIRYLLKYYTDLAPTSAYKGDTSKDHDTTLFIKTHDIVLDKFRKIIHIIRNPFDSFYSYWNYRLNYIKDNPEWDEHLDHCCSFWKKHTKNCLNIKSLKIHIRYEDLITDCYDQLKKIVEFSDLEVNPEKIGYAVKQADFRRLRKLPKRKRIEWEKKPKKFFSSGKAGYGKKYFSLAHQKRVIDKVGDLMEMFGYNTNADCKSAC